ncbi:NAD-dependent protein deacetylase of SIR2 family [bacterium]|nr:NAD-dependent protein deacetylase of SIR2 family [bacterium]
MPIPVTLPDDRLIEETLARLARAERVLIGAGAGLSVDAGINYLDTAYFARRFPAMLQYGFTCQYEFMGDLDWSEELQWGYLADHVNAVRYETPAQPVYTKLFELVKDKDYFVITSNVDAQFAKGGFSEGRIFTRQGRYDYLQCLAPCTTEVWPIEPVIDRILPVIDPATQQVTDPDVIPRCPHCGGPVFMNVRGGPWFVEEPYEALGEQFNDWLDDAWGAPLLLVEIGAGFNTPSVIRWPMEQIAQQHPDAHLLRVNPDYPQLPPELSGKATSVRSGGLPFIEALHVRRSRGKLS